jgi:hypothetical protein
MQRITKDQFEDILFNTNIPVTEKRSFKRSSIRGKKQATVKLVSNGVVLAVREVTPEGDFYYKT